VGAQPNDLRELGWERRAVVQCPRNSTATAEGAGVLRGANPQLAYINSGPSGSALNRLDIEEQVPRVPSPRSIGGARVARREFEPASYMRIEARELEAGGTRPGS
jgi:hypothetical protein